MPLSGISSSYGNRFSSGCDGKLGSPSKFCFRDQGFSGVAAGANCSFSGRRSPVSAPAGRLFMIRSSLSTGNVQVTDLNT